MMLIRRPDHALIDIPKLSVGNVVLTGDDLNAYTDQVSLDLMMMRSTGSGQTTVILHQHDVEIILIFLALNDLLDVFAVAGDRPRQSFEQHLIHLDHSLLP